MSLKEILDKPGFEIDETAAENLGIVAGCLETDFTGGVNGKVLGFVPDYEHKCVSLQYETYYLSGRPEMPGDYLANLFRLVDAVAITPCEQGRTRITFTSVVWW